MKSSGAERQGKKSRAGDGDRARDIGDGKMLQKKSQGKMNEDREVRIEKKREQIRDMVNRDYQIIFSVGSSLY